jgi:hypothetical protein
MILPRTEMKLSVQKKWTFWQRFGREVVFFGLPMVCLELIGLPLLGWGAALALLVPATLIGLLVYTAVEHLLVSALADGKSSQ